ncbi:MAG: transposase [Rhodobacteraceae bacterium]|nr:transposase [Paracoccaceae bacterium]MYF46381.1 transposase [Paracoccaceae bacterium]MYI92148.1 transposase [Paracoccaceae bacterium]
MSKIRFRKHASIPGLLSTIRTSFTDIPDPVRHRGFTIVDCLMSGAAIFKLKAPSLLYFDRMVRGEKARSAVVGNLRNLFGVDKAPSDTCLRERLDRIDPVHLRSAFRAVLANLQRSKGLEHFTVLGGHYLLSLDGTGYYSSNKVHCSSCCTKANKDGTTGYYHQMMGGALVHPGSRIVIPLAPEMITRQDGSEKNDCERNAAKRFLTDYKKEHPHLRTIVVEDALAANGPHIKHLQDLDLRYIIGVKHGDHKLMFEWIDSHPDPHTHTHTEGTPKGVVTHRFRWYHDVPLNDANFDLEVSVLQYSEIRPDGETTNWTWITDLPLNKERMMTMMKSARSRWKIENETFKTLKSEPDGYHFEHNYGHGKQHLASVMAYLCMLVFLIEQVEQLCCPYFQKALKEQVRKKYMWEEMRLIFYRVILNDWETLYRLLSDNDWAMDGELLLAEP